MRVGKYDKYSPKERLVLASDSDRSKVQLILRSSTWRPFVGCPASPLSHGMHGAKAWRLDQVQDGRMILFGFGLARSSR